jgi:SAM-dependent methyltransferase
VGKKVVGIGYHGLQFLRFAAGQARVGRVATIGRQELGLGKQEVCSLIDVGPEYKHEQYCESLLLQHFGAACVESWDYSNYEGANHIADMNKPLNDRLSTYDTVIDAGSLEHVYNAPQALQNVSELCRDGGQILHMLPGNNFCGHGFWQFSPELFFSLYCESNGYSETRVFLASEYRTDVWYEVVKPGHGQRANVISFTPTFVLCRTVKTRKSCHDSVQQSDYIHVWQQDEKTQLLVDERPMWRAKIRSALQTSALVDFAYMVHIKLSGKRSLSGRNPHLTARSLRFLVCERALPDSP